MNDYSDCIMRFCVYQWDIDEHQYTFGFIDRFWMIDALQMNGWWDFSIVHVS